MTGIVAVAQGRGRGNGPPAPTPPGQERKVALCLSQRHLPSSASPQVATSCCITGDSDATKGKVRPQDTRVVDAFIACRSFRKRFLFWRLGGFDAETGSRSGPVLS